MKKHTSGIHVGIILGPFRECFAILFQHQFWDAILIYNLNLHLILNLILNPQPYPYPSPSLLPTLALLFILPFLLGGAFKAGERGT